MLDAFFLAVNAWMTGGTALAALGCFLWGLVSVLFSPCHLASIPLIVGYVAGQETLDAELLNLKVEAPVAAPAASAPPASATGAFTIAPMSLAECESKLISAVLASVDVNRNKAAEVLKIHRTTLYRALAPASEDDHETPSPISDGPW